MTELWAESAAATALYALENAAATLPVFIFSQLRFPQRLPCPVP